MEHKDRYTQALRHIRTQNDRASCVPLMISLVTELAPADAFEECRLAGRVPGDGMFRDDWMPLLEHLLGKKLEMIVAPRKPSGGGYTMKTIHQFCGKGTWVIGIRRHVATMIDGQVYDWSEGRRHYIRYVIKIRD